jgi:mycothiol synthase
MEAADVWPSGVIARAIEKTDVEAWAELVAAKEKIDQEGKNYDAEDLRGVLDAPNVDAGRDSIALWVGRRMVAFGFVRTPVGPADVHRLLTVGGVHPEWRGRGLGDAVLRWLIHRASDLHKGTRPAAVGEVNAYAINTNTSAHDLLTTRGFERCRHYFHMHRMLGGESVPDVALPDGLRFICFDPSYDEDLRVVHNEVFLDNWGSSPHDAESWNTSITGSRTFRGGLSFLVLAGDQIVAYALGYESVANTERTGIREVYVGQVGTRRQYRGCGLARGALAQVMAEAERKGFERVSLGVDAENPSGALELYEKLGFRTVTQTAMYRLKLS